MRKKKEQLPPPVSESDSLDLPPPPLPPEDKKDLETPVEVPSPRKPREARPVRWRVVREVLANVNGNITRLAEGQMLDPLGYGDAVIASLREQGVALEPAE